MFFDRVVVVDWSAASTPRLGADSIWIADSDHATTEVVNLPTRAAAFERLASIVDHRGGLATLIGVDFSLGYPRGTATAWGLAGPEWQSTWQLLADVIVDDDRNTNNRFEVAAQLNQRVAERTGVVGRFWGCPSRRASATLTTHKSPPGPIAGPAGPREWRYVEDQLRRSGRRPFSAWQLLGAGAVGSQMLVGIPIVERLRRRAPERVAVWPFTTGLGAPEVKPDSVVIVEVWPSLFDIEAGGDTVRDARQVRAVADWLWATQRERGLDHLFSPNVPPSIVESICREEGWVLGTDHVSCRTDRSIGRAEGRSLARRDDSVDR